MKRLLLFTLFIFTVIFGANAQNAVVGRISATVIDSLTKQPVEYAVVALYPKDKTQSINGGVTDEKGKFTLQNVAPGEYRVVVGFMGYKSKTIVAITTGAKLDLNLGNVELLSTETKIESVEFVGTKPLVENKIDKLVYNAEQDITNVGGDASDVMRKVPMLTVDADGNIQLRGSSAVRVLINGKPSGTMANSVADALKMIPADEIKNVEVITSPSAKYDSEGAGGIINIITKKKTAEGINGSATVSTGTRQNNGNFSLNGKKGRLGVTSNLGVMYSIPQDTRIILENITTTSNITQNGLNRANRWGLNGGVGVDYDFNKYHNFSTNVRLNKFLMSTDGSFQSTTVLNGISTAFTRITDNETPINNLDWSADYRLTTDKQGEEFSISGQASFGRNTNRFTSSVVQPGVPTFSTIGDNTGKNNEYTVQTDYVLPIGAKMKFETGLKGIFRDIMSKYQNTNQDFDYSQNVASAYVVFTAPITEKITANAGLRTEYTDIKGLSGNSVSYKNDYFNLFPSVVLSRAFSPFTMLKVSYNKRMQRPSLFYLNPFLNDSDPQNQLQGNPNLAPEISDNIELGYSTFIKGTVINASVFYRNTKAIIEHYYFPAQKLTTYLNLGKSESYGMNVFASYSPIKNWNLITNIGVNSYEVKDPLTNKSSGTHLNYNIMGRTSLILKKGWNTEAFMVLNSTRRTFQGESGGIKIYGAALKKEIWNKMGSVGINVLNPFGRDLHIVNRNSGTNFVQNMDIYFPIRSFGVNFSYKFGKLKFAENKGKIKNDDLKAGEQQQGGMGGI